MYPQKSVYGKTEL